MSIEDVVLVATVREDIRDDDSQTEIPLRIEATQARIAKGDDIGPVRYKSRVVKEPVLVEAVTAGPGAEVDSDNGSKTVATSPEEDVKHDDDEHLVSPSMIMPFIETLMIDKTLLPKAGASVSVVSLGESSKQEVEGQTQEATLENGPGDRVDEDPSESKDESSEKGPKKTEETRETGIDSEADKVKTETTRSEAPRVADTLTEEPETQEETKGPERAEEASGPPANPRTAAPVAPEPQPPARAAPLYWRRLTARYMTVGPQPS
jgi:hypothetical protein